MEDVLMPWQRRTENRILLAAGMIGFILLATISFLFYFRRQRKLDNARAVSEYRYRKLYDEGSDPIVLIGPDMRYIDCNAAALRFSACRTRKESSARKSVCSRAKAAPNCSNRTSPTDRESPDRRTPAI